MKWLENRKRRIMENNEWNEKVLEATAALTRAGEKQTDNVIKFAAAQVRFADDLIAYSNTVRRMAEANLEYSEVARRYNDASINQLECMKKNGAVWK